MYQSGSSVAVLLMKLLHLPHCALTVSLTVYQREATSSTLMNYLIWLTYIQTQTQIKLHFMVI